MRNNRWAAVALAAVLAVGGCEKAADVVERDDDGQPLSLVGKILAAAGEMEKGAAI